MCQAREDNPLEKVSDIPYSSGIGGTVARDDHCALLVINIHNSGLDFLYLI